jgi:hypothetical protein
MAKSRLHVFLCTLYFCFIITVAFTQKLFIGTKYQVETGVYLSTFQTPFWSRTNQYGIVPLESQFLTFRGAAHKDYSKQVEEKRAKRFDFGYGFSSVINVGKSNHFYLQEAYVKTRYKSLEFFAGRRKEIVGLVDSTLSSGSYAWSGNALPMPKVQFHIQNYMPIIGKGVISIKGSYGLGWFNNDQLSQSYLHQKSLYSRIGKENWKIKFYGGFNHQVQWGGKINLPYKLNTVKSNQLPSSFSDYVFVVSGISLNYQSRQKNIDTTKYTDFDLTNRVGNHLGTIDIGIEVNTKTAKILFYRQNLYDDGSLFSLANIADGLNGVSIVPINTENKKVIIERLTFEFLNTSNQGGFVGPTSTIPEIRGRDNYFNHPQFLNGWSYKNKTIGTPFITPTENTKNIYPKYLITNSPNYLEYFTNNNRVQVYHLGVQLKILDKYNYLFRGSYSKNFGSYDSPFTNSIKGITQYSFQNSLEFNNRKKLKFNINWAFDIGSLYQPSNGVSCSIKKQW